MRSLPPRSRGERGEVELERIRLMQREARLRRASCRAASATRSRSISMASSDACGACEHARVSAPRPGPISTSRSPAAGAMTSTMRSSTAGSCRKCWPKRLRARISGACPELDRHVGWPRSRLLASASARAGQIQRRAVIDRRAHDRQAERDVHGAVEGGVLDHRQALVVVHRERWRRSRRRCAARRRCRPEPAPSPVDACARARGDRRRDDADLLVARVPAFARVRIEAAHADARRRDAPPLQIAIDDA